MVKNRTRMPIAQAWRRLLSLLEAVVVVVMEEEEEEVVVSLLLLVGGEWTVIFGFGFGFVARAWEVR